MRNLADKAYALSLKYDLSDEAELIKIEEQKLAEYLKEANITSSSVKHPSRRHSPGSEEGGPNDSTSHRKKALKPGKLETRPHHRPHQA
jgi:hypothetical protein